MSRLTGLACSLVLLLPASASAATTRFTSPASTRQGNPCTSAKPCELEWALKHSAKGDTVRLKSGTYGWPGGNNHSLALPGGVKLRGIVGPGRPKIKQTAHYPSYNGALLDVGSRATVRDVAIDQSVGGAGAIDLPASATVERAVLTGENGMYFIGGKPTGVLRDTLVVASSGAAITAQAEATYHLENVTAIAHGANGDALAVRGFTNQPVTLRAVNTIVRGDRYDVVVDSVSGSSARAIIRNSNYRTSAGHTHLTGANSKLIGTSIQSKDPLFVSPTNFHERKGSVTINSGTAKGVTGRRDLDGLKRRVGPAPDIGAYEYAPPFLGVSIGKNAPVGADGRVAVRLTCPAKTIKSCAGKLKLVRTSNQKLLGSTEYYVKTGKSRTVKVLLSHAARTALNAGKTVNVTARAAAHDGAGQSRTTTRNLQLKR